MASDATPRIVLYAVLAGLSPLALLSTLAVLSSGRGRLNGTVFAIAFLLSQSAVLLLAVFLSSAATPDNRNHTTFASVLELVLGLGFFGLGWRIRRTAPPEQHAKRSRVQALLSRLHGLTPVATFSVGLLLGVGGAKRLTITVIAGATIAVGSLLPAEEFALGVLFVVLAGLLVWLPVALYLVAGSRADGLNERARSWLVSNERPVTAASMLVLGAALAVDSAVRLL